MGEVLPACLDWGQSGRANWGEGSREVGWLAPSLIQVGGRSGVGPAGGAGLWVVGELANRGWDLGEGLHAVGQLALPPVQTLSSTSGQTPL